MVMPFALARSNDPLVAGALSSRTRVSRALVSTSSCRLPAPPARRPGPRPRVARRGAAGSGDMRSRVYDDGFSESRRERRAFCARARGCARGSVGRCVSGVREIWRENVLPAPRSRAFGADGGVNLARFRVWDVSVTRLKTQDRGDRDLGELGRRFSQRARRSFCWEFNKYASGI